MPDVPITGVALGKQLDRPMEDAADRPDHRKSRPGTEAPERTEIPIQPGSPAVEFPDDPLDFEPVSSLPVPPHKPGAADVGTWLGQALTLERITINNGKVRSPVVTCVRMIGYLTLFLFSCLVLLRILSLLPHVTRMP